MSAAFFWFAIFPFILGGIILTIFIVFLRREGKKTANTKTRRITPAEFINEVAQYANMDKVEVERMIEHVFTYFPGFNWRNNLPKVGDRKSYEGDEEKEDKNEVTVENKKTRAGESKGHG